MTATTEEKFEFKTEIQELLHLIIHTLYSHKEIFLRELLSNASDALSKVQFEALTNDKLYDKDQPLEVCIKIDKDAKTLKVEDTGVGMTRESLITQIGTIAHSGTKRFMQELSKQKDLTKAPELIGQFGVGFYSVFMVADQVTIETKSHIADEAAIRWSSDGTGTYTVAASDRRKRGTSITLHLKEEASEFLEDYRVKNLITQYSNYLPFPVLLGEEKVNQPEALWRKSKSEVSEEEYKEFYKTFAGDWQDSMFHEHLSADAPVQFSALLYVPKMAPMEFYGQPNEHGLKLYAKRVFIMENNKSLVPKFLRFLKGVVESEDIPLNVSRETIQNDANITKINKIITKKMIDAFSKLAKNEEESYLEFWKQFGRYIKEGVHGEFSYREKLLPLLRFFSTKNADAPKMDLATYAAEKAENQKAIYYAVGENLDHLRKNPQLKFFEKHNMTVLLLTEPMDDLVLSSVGEYDGLKFINIEAGDLELPEDIKKEVEDVNVEGDLKKLQDKVRDVLQDKVKEVRFSKQLTDYPSRFYNAEGGMSHNVRKLMFRVDGMPGTPLKRDLELNPEHPFVQSLGADLESENVGDRIMLLYHMAALLDGSLEDHQDLARLILPMLQS